MKQIILKIIVIVIILALSLCIFLLFAKTQDRGPGSYSPGYKTTTIKVPHREVPLNISIWYPTNEQISPELIGQNALFYGRYIRKNAQPSKDAYPLIIFSHGSGGSALQMGWLAEELVKNGYIVLATNHPRTTTGNSLPEKTVMIWERTNDLHELINWAEKPTIDGLSFDTQNVGVIGFSLGGHSALSMAGLKVMKSNFIDYCERKYHKSKLTNNFFEKKLDVNATTRNWKTVLKLSELSKQN